MTKVLMYLVLMLLTSNVLAGDNLPSLGGEEAKTGKNIFQSAEVSIFCCSRHKGGDKNGKLNENNPGAALDLDFRQWNDIPGKFFITAGDVENSHRGRAKFFGFGWKKRDILELGPVSFGGGISVLDFRYEVPEKSRTMERILPAGFGSVSYESFSLKIAPAPGKAVILFGSYEKQF